MRNTITDDVRRALESAGLESAGLESGFIESDPEKAMVLVYRLDLTESRLTAAPPPVVKFSKSCHAIPNSKAKDIKLATPEYYRNYPAGKGGKYIRDKKEAQFEERRQVKLEGGPGAKMKVTYERNDCWIFCTSVKPTTDRELQTMRKACSADYDCATTIADPSEFAKELGAIFAAYAEWSAVSLSPLDELCRQLRLPEIGNKTVWVYHGPVVYRDNSETVIKPLPEKMQAAAVPFVKRERFLDQREYRFIVMIGGEPKEPEIYLPISPALRRLAKIE